MESGAPSTPGSRELAPPTSRSAKAGLRLVRKISAVHFRIARSGSLRSAIWCSPRRNGRSLSSAYKNGGATTRKSSFTSRPKARSSVFARSWRAPLKRSILWKERWRADFVFPRLISSSSPPRNYLDDSRPIRAGVYVVRNAIAHRLISVSSTRAISSCTSSMASGRFLGLDETLSSDPPAGRDRVQGLRPVPTQEGTAGSSRARVCRRSEALCSARAGLSGFPLRWRRKKIATSQLTRRRKMGPGQNKGGGFHI